jgi:MarR family transcriptional regulator, organic hydroperoxide resistance regulator
MHIVSQAVRARQSDSAAPGPAPHYVIGRATPYLLNRLAERMNAEFRAVLRPFRLTLRHWRVLAFLQSAGPVPIVALERDAMIPHSTLSRLCARMERASLIRRAPGKAQDLRWATYSLTREGERLYQRALPHVVALNERLLDKVAAAQRENLDRHLARMLANLDKEKEEKR